MELETINKLYLELSQVTSAKTARELALEDLLRSAHAIAVRKGEDTAWERFAASIQVLGIGSITPRVYKVLPSDDRRTPSMGEIEAASAIQALETMKKELDNSEEFAVRSVCYDVSEVIHSLLGRKKMTRKEFAGKMGTSVAYVTKMLRGDTNFTLAQLVRIARIFDCDIRTFFTSATPDQPTGGTGEGND